MGPTINPATNKSQYIILHPIFWDLTRKSCAEFARHIDAHLQHTMLEAVHQQPRQLRQFTEQAPLPIASRKLNDHLHQHFMKELATDERSANRD